MKQELAGSFGRFHTQLRNRSLLYTLGSRRSYDSIYLLTAIGLTPGGSSTIHIYTQTIQEQHSSLIRKSADRAPSLRVIPWHLPYN